VDEKVDACAFSGSISINASSSPGIGGGEATRTLPHRALPPRHAYAANRLALSSSNVLNR